METGAGMSVVSIRIQSVWITFLSYNFSVVAVVAVMFLFRSLHSFGSFLFYDYFSFVLAAIHEPAGGDSYL